jgi:serine phosphatase RsbU (regulator of sigma subunit)
VKQQKSILRQLLVNILLPVLGLFLVVFFLTYRYGLNKLESDSRKQKANIVAETKNLIAYFDYAMRSHERSFIDRMRQTADSLQNRFAGIQRLDELDLYEISRQLGLDTSREHIYLINRKLVIVNTTFPKDLGLDFTKLSDNYLSFFGDLFRVGRFKEDRFGLEMNTGRIKKYAFLATKDKKYIIELGFYSPEAENYRKLLLTKIESLGKRYSGIEKVHLYLGVKGVPDVNMTDKRQIQAYLKCLESKKPQVLITDNDQTTPIEQTEYLFLPVLETKLYAGYILQLDTNNSQEQFLLSELFWRFLIFFLLTGVFLSVVVYIRARKITRPIVELSEMTKSVNTGNLMEHISIKGSSELESLSDNFNNMIDSLRVSYEGLEEKVAIRTDELYQQKVLVEHKNQEIVDSINYARFIQQALLPSSSEVTSYFNHSYVYYAPKDIIAGDFYWFDHANETTWFAVADCTGHGVPGAMVSVLCINALNQQLAEDRTISSGVLLDKVRDFVVKTLNKEQGSVKDGMDISLCCYHHPSKQLQWSGANNPLWLVRNGELIPYLPNKQPIGMFENAEPFTTHQLQLEKNDLIVLFTDGYADQFGGPKGKKYKYAPLKELIVSHADIPVKELGMLLEETFTDWKGDLEQTDDVCVMVIRINDDRIF